MSKKVQQFTDCTAPLASSARTEVGGRGQGAKGRRKGRKERESPSSFFATFASKKLRLIRKNVKQAQPELAPEIG